MSLTSEDRDWIAGILESKFELFKLRLVLEYYEQRSKFSPPRMLIERVAALEERVATLERRLGPEPESQSLPSASPR